MHFYHPYVSKFTREYVKNSPTLKLLQNRYFLLSENISGRRGKTFMGMGGSTPKNRWPYPPSESGPTKMTYPLSEVFRKYLVIKMQ